MQVDYGKLGFKCGIEIHQRLATAKKLFCDCRADPAPPGEEPSGTIRRRLRAVAGELGKVDPAAAFEQARGREFVYQSFSDRSCEVERDEEPPHQLNPEALETALVAAKMLGATVLDELQVMRKTVVDGSAVSGFQRTLLAAVNGSLETSRGRVGIPTICLEEESSGIVEGGGAGGEVTYRLDRQGIPLLEIATDASIKDGAHAREAAEKIGLMLRNTGRVQRGIGTIRQDLNVSVRGGARVEVKGAQELSALAELVENEARRQLALIEVKHELEKRGAKQPNAEGVLNVSKTFSATKCGILKKALEKKHSVAGLRLPGFAGLLEKELMPNHRLGTEFSHFARARTGIGGLIHSGEDTAKYGISVEERKALENELNCGKEDAWAVVADAPEKARQAAEAVAERAAQCFAGVPGETRKADGVRTVYMRPLPGAERMYPETDVPPIPVTAEMLARAKAPEGIEEKKRKYLGMGLNEVLADKMLAAPEAQLFERLAQAHEGAAEPAFVAVTLLETMKSLRRDGVAVERVGEKQLAEILGLYSKGAVTRAAVPELIAAVAGAPAPAAVEKIGKIMEEKKLAKFGARELRQAVEEAKKKGAKTADGVFAEVMRRHRFNADARELKKILE
ncbi:MAG: Glu-tRNA(Gln) amidotransferase subunit GatE [Candidatus Micrarchaeota archaeon]|nr:Glu-tRNA(Gln) amidotransferase subunit GatE [Candidatus Micrarchaeota archaeon]